MDRWRALVDDFEGLADNPAVEPGELDTARTHLHALHRKRSSLSDEELRRLYDCARQVTEEAVAVLRERMGEELHHKVRDFLQVHNKGGQPCPRCGSGISQLTANQRITSYCRHCQPGSLLRN